MSPRFAILPPSIYKEHIMAESGFTYARLRQLAVDDLLVLGAVLWLAVEFSA
jgi:hypothetical protein